MSHEKHGARPDLEADKEAAKILGVTPAEIFQMRARIGWETSHDLDHIFHPIANRRSHSFIRDKIAEDVAKLNDQYRYVLKNFPDVVDLEIVTSAGKEKMTKAEIEQLAKEQLLRRMERKVAMRRREVPPGQFMDWFAKACFKEKYDSVFEPLITDYRMEVRKSRDAGYSRLQLAKLHTAYWIGFAKACGVFALVERVTKYFTSN